VVGKDGRRIIVAAFLDVGRMEHGGRLDLTPGEEVVLVARQRGDAALVPSVAIVSKVSATEGRTGERRAWWQVRKYISPTKLEKLTTRLDEDGNEELQSLPYKRVGFGANRQDNGLGYEDAA
jgi:hypothetical protein